jgi:hypothetical protein
VINQEAFFTSPIAGFYTLRDLADRTGISLDEMIRLVETLRVPPRERHGVVRLWDDAALAILRKQPSRS